MQMADEHGVILDAIAAFSCVGENGEVTYCYVPLQDGTTELSAALGLIEITKARIISDHLRIIE